MNRALIAVLFSATAALACATVQAGDTTPQPMTKHQLMKDCMAKQKASDGGMPKEDMKRACKDVTATEVENQKTEKKEEAAEKPAAAPQP
jgi:hypothetical protein